MTNQHSPLYLWLRLINSEVNALTVTISINENRTLSFSDSLDGKWFQVEAKDHRGNVLASGIRVSKEDIKRLAKSS